METSRSPPAASVQLYIFASVIKKKKGLFKYLGYIQKCNYLIKVSSALRDYVWVSGGKREQMNKALLQIISSKTC